MIRQTLSEKIKLLIESSKAYRGILYIGFLFITLGTLLIYIGLRFDIIFLIVFGGIFISVALFFLIYTIPSSMIHYYEKALVKKHGKYTTATILDKEIIDNSYYDKNTYAVDSMSKGKRIEELNYVLKYTFEYQSKEYKNSAFVQKNEFETLNVGDKIPIRFLKTDPNTSFVRKIKLKNLTDSIIN
ncbi:conserved hypothetical protein [Formosa agariphila KMM 3901]|uniref:DUF3592 domain-containing protein n=1 Tax=Formosa agariphila (strain DSM 15362 / KCTC 12365 / LMG 23005 / KMM 3901 / M-2Alg 35-1) TaxID=1347342 RepID=T2KLI7_FORAG|nr:hypothetical protein [Formosa agariphila]CDF79767.1 conserved hypothetical protein [Formosa agariphila KMM 3901]